MIRTENDIRAALRSLTDEDAVARLSDLVHHLDEPRDRRRRVWMAAPLAAAATVAAVGAAAVLASSGPDASPHAGGHVSVAEKLRPVWTIRVHSVPGYAITRSAVTRLDPDPVDLVADSAAVRGTATPASGSLWHTPDVQARGRLDYDRLVAKLTRLSGAGERVVVNGHAGWFFGGRRLEQQNADGGISAEVWAHPWQAAEAAPDYEPQLVWRFADGSVGTLVGTFGFQPDDYAYDNREARTDMLRIARATAVGVHDPVTMPFRLTPSDAVAPESVYMGVDVPCLGYGNGRGQYPGYWVGSVMTVCRVHTGATRAATIASTRIREDESGVVVVRDLADGTSLVVEVDPRRTDVVSPAEARRLAFSADVSPELSDAATWLTV